MSASTAAIRNTMSKALSHAKITRRPSSGRGHADHGWLNTYHTFSFANYYDPKHMQFGSLRVLNEDRVAAGTGFPTHPHRDAEIFSYILSGELTHRDSMVKAGAETATNGAAAAHRKKDDFYRMHRGDVQFTTGGSGIAHSEQNESKEWVHFLQIWATPWARGLKPRYHTRAFDEEAKKKAFVTILSPLKAGPGASAEEEEAALPAVPETIPIHADLMMGAGIIAPGGTFHWTVGAGGADSGGTGTAVKKPQGRKVYVHLAMMKGGKSKVKLDGREVLSEGDGAYIDNVNAGDSLAVESIGDADAEVVILDSD